MIHIQAEQFHEEFIKAAQNKSTSSQYLIDLLNHPYGVNINFTDNDYEGVKLIEENHKDLLEFILLKRIKVEGRIQIDNRYVDANSYYCILSNETKKDSKLALNILIKGKEYLHHILPEVKTPEFLNKLKDNYAYDIFDFEFIYTKEYKTFLIEYIQQHKLSKKITISEELLNDRDFIVNLSQYNCNLFNLVNHIYHQDIEIMRNIALKEPQSFQQMSSKMRNTISDNEKNALDLIELNSGNFDYLAKNMQSNINCIHKVLSIKPAMYENFLPSIKEDEILTIEFIKKYDIDIFFLSDKVKGNREIATIMTAKDGANLEQFNIYKQDKELIDLALKTSKKISIIPESERTWEKVEQIVFSATEEENSFNLHYLPRVMKEDRQFIFKAVEKDVFFKEDIFALVNDYGKHRNDYEVVKKCIENHNDLYGRFYSFKEDYEIIHIYIEGMKKERNGNFSLNLIPQKIKAEASMLKAPVDKYVLNKTIEKKAQNWKKDDSIKVKRTKI